MKRWILTASSLGRPITHLIHENLCRPREISPKHPSVHGGPREIKEKRPTNPCGSPWTVGPCTACGLCGRTMRAVPTHAHLGLGSAPRALVHPHTHGHPACPLRQPAIGLHCFVSRDIFYRTYLLHSIFIWIDLILVGLHSLSQILL